MYRKNCTDYSEKAAKNIPIFRMIFQTPLTKPALYSQVRNQARIFRQMIRSAPRAPALAGGIC